MVKFLNTTPLPLRIWGGDLKTETGNSETGNNILGDPKIETGNNIWGGYKN